MKKILINFAWVIIAFIIGLTINEACAKIDDATKSSSDNKEILERISELEERLAKIEGMVDISTPAYTEIDDLTFFPNGIVANKCISGPYYGIVTGTPYAGMKYSYDDKGRLSTIQISSGDIWAKYKFSYSGKKVTVHGSDSEGEEITYVSSFE